MMRKLLFGAAAFGFLISIMTDSISAQTAENTAGDAVTQCIKRFAETQKYKKRVCTTIGARASSPGIKGGARHAENRGCITATKGYAIIGAPEVTELMCHGGRCKHEPIEKIGDQGITTQVCVTVRAWSGGQPFGPGGFGKYRMCADVEQPLTADSVIEIVEKCEQASHP